MRQRQWWAQSLIQLVYANLTFLMQYHYQDHQLEIVSNLLSASSPHATVLHLALMRLSPDLLFQ